MTDSETVVYIVDDDASVREALTRLLKSVGLRSQAFASGREFLDASLPDAIGCVLLDVRMPGMSGLEVQELLEGRGSALPVIFVTGHGSIPMSVRAMKSGAVDFLTKPFDEQELLDAVNQALDRDRSRSRPPATEPGGDAGAAGPTGRGGGPFPEIPRARTGGGGRGSSSGRDRPDREELTP